jgi:hypothetical protein
METNLAVPLRDALVGLTFKVTALSAEDASMLIIQQRYIDKFMKHDQTASMIKEALIGDAACDRKEALYIRWRLASRAACEVPVGG